MFAGRGATVGKVTCYGFDGPRIELGWRQDFPQLSRPAVDLYQTAVQCDGSSKELDLLQQTTQKYSSRCPQTG